MIGHWLPTLGDSEETRTGIDEYYECTYCLAAFDEWLSDCPACGQLVVRIVVPPP